MPDFAGKTVYRLRFRADRPQQKCRQMSAIVDMRGAGRWLRCMPRTHLIEASDRRGLAFASRRTLVPLPAATTATLILAVLARFRAFRWRRRLAHPRNALPNQLLNRRNALAVSRRNYGDCGAASPGAADAMHIIVGMVRHVEVEDV